MICIYLSSFLEEKKYLPEIVINSIETLLCEPMACVELNGEPRRKLAR